MCLFKNRKNGKRDLIRTTSAYETKVVKRNKCGRGGRQGERNGKR